MIFTVSARGAGLCEACVGQKHAIGKSGAGSMNFEDKGRGSERIGGLGVRRTYASCDLLTLAASDSVGNLRLRFGFRESSPCDSLNCHNLRNI